MLSLLPQRPGRLSLAQKARRAAVAAALAAAAAALAAPPSFRPALPGYAFEFPRDHGSHDEYQTEWWYFTGHLLAEDGRRAGFEVTFFRVGVVPASAPAGNAWDLRNVSLAHFALSDFSGKEFRYYEKLSRASPFTAGARTGTLDVFNEGWSVRMMPGGMIRLRAAQADDSVDLLLDVKKPPAIHGENGVSVKAAGKGYASHYYSLTRLEVDGTITLAGTRQKCSGIAWMDHEFGSSQLRENQQGWDWFSVQLDNQTELMLYQIRRVDGTPDTTSAGSLVLPDGNVIHLRAGQFTVRPLGRWKSRKSGATYPMGWRIEVPPLNISLTLRERFPQQELITTSSTHVTYWEGAVEATGSYAGTPARGVGYVEMTGYDRKFGE